MNIKRLISGALASLLLITNCCCAQAKPVDVSVNENEIIFVPYKK